jgi:hypothetical protein
MLETLETFKDITSTQPARTTSQVDFHKALDTFCDTWIESVKDGRRAARDFREDFDSTMRKRPFTSVFGGVVLGAVLGSVVGWTVCRRS